MNRLLSAHFARLWKNKVFWLGTAGMFIWAVLVLVTEYPAASKIPEFAPALDEYFFDYALLTGGLCAVFVGLFVGTEYSDGTIRNKLIVGHSRKAVYVSNMIVCVTAVLIMIAAYLTAMLAVGVPLFGWLERDPVVVLQYLLVTVFMVIAFVSIFIPVSMLNQNKANAVVIAFLLFLAILFLAAYCQNALDEPEMASNGFIITSDGVVDAASEPFPNPHYVSGTLRMIYMFIINFLPAGQSILLSLGREIAAPLFMTLYSLIITVITTVSGVFLFERKNIK